MMVMKAYEFVPSPCGDGRQDVRNIHWYDM